jgi:hypothetical protein
MQQISSLELIVGNVDVLLFRLIVVNLIVYGAVAMNARWPASKGLHELLLLVTCSEAGHLADILFGTHFQLGEMGTDPARNAALTLWLARGILRFAIPLLSMRRGSIGITAKALLSRIDQSVSRRSPGSIGE